MMNILCCSYYLKVNFGSPTKPATPSCVGTQYRDDGRQCVKWLGVSSDRLHPPLSWLQSYTTTEYHHCCCFDFVLFRVEHWSAEEFVYCSLPLGSNYTRQTLSQAWPEAPSLWCFGWLILVQNSKTHHLPQRMSAGWVRWYGLNTQCSKSPILNLSYMLCILGPVLLILRSQYVESIVHNTHVHNKRIMAAWDKRKITT